MNTAVISAGSNIDPKAAIEKAHNALAAEFELVACAKILRTKPVGFAEQPDFYNTAFLVRTGLNQSGLKEHLRRIEDRLGRVRSGNKYGPRTIDLDIAVFNGTITDPDVLERDFVRELVVELMPGLKNRISSLTSKG